MLNRYKSEEGRKLVLSSYDRLMAQWGVEVGERDIPTSWGATHVLAAGAPSNPPLVLFHGVGDDSALMWVYNAKALAAHFRLYAVDALGGPGKSEPNERYFQDFDQVKWLDEVFSGLELDRAHVAGVSYGSYLAQLYALERPERVERAVGMAGALACGHRRGGMLRTMSIFLPEALFPTEKNTAKLLRKLSGTNAAVFTDNPDLMRHWTCLLKYFNNRSMAYHHLRTFEPRQYAPLRDRLLILIGDRDPIAYHPEALEQLSRAGVRFRILEGAGHGINHEQAALVNEVLTEYLTRGTVPDDLK